MRSEGARVLSFRDAGQHWHGIGRAKRDQSLSLLRFPSRSAEIGDVDDEGPQEISLASVSA